MVLLVAALYTYYQHCQQKQQQQQQGSNTTATLSDDIQGTTNNSDINNTNSSLASSIYHHTIARCNSVQQQQQGVEAESTQVHFFDNMRSNTMTAVSLPPELVRQTWVEAVFGHSENHTQQKQQQYRLRKGSSTHHAKVGLTVARLPLGVYVRAVDPQSEAASAGVLVGSVLHSVNGMCFLGEPTKTALERLWQYQQECHRRCVPVSMEFLYQDNINSNTQEYTVLFLSSPLSWGISWATCADVALIRRVYGKAAEVGIPRGGILTAVNQMTIQTMDHVQAAAELKTAWESDHEIVVRLAVPPAWTRTSYYEREHGLESSRHVKPLVQTKSVDGVEIKFHPFATLCHVGGLPHETKEGPLQELAEQVAAGLVDGPFCPPPEIPIALGLFCPCPSLTNDELLALWDPLEALLYCLRFQAFAHDEDAFLRNASLPRHESPIEALQDLSNSPKAAKIVSAFILQFISLICSPGNYLTVEAEESKASAAQTPGLSKKQANDLTSILLKLSRKDEGFCQRLYFLLRSYISTFETRKPSKDDNSRNLMALLNCLELLRFAEKELAGRTLHAGGEAGTYLEMTSPAPSPIAASPDSSVGDPNIDKKRGKFGLFRKKKNGNHVNASAPPRRETTSRQGFPASTSSSLSQSPSTMYENMSDFLGELDRICGTIERSLQKSFRQKIADWATQPWSASKDSALANVTTTMRENLREITQAAPNKMLLVNPVDSSELLSSLDYHECYILPSAHFPVLLTFNVRERRGADNSLGEEKIYRTCVEICSLKCSTMSDDRSYVVHGAVAGTVEETGSNRPLEHGSSEYRWGMRKILIFQTRSSWGAPQTLSLRLSSKLKGSKNTVLREEGYCWVDLSRQWELFEDSNEPVTSSCKVGVRRPESDESMFDEHGELLASSMDPATRMELHVNVTTDIVDFDDTASGSLLRKRMLLYKHDDDLRQEAFAVHFVNTCDKILKASGLDLKLLTFQCIPVGTRRGFVEWVPGSVPLSEICQPFATTILAPTDNTAEDDDDDEDVCDDDHEEGQATIMTKAGLTKFESLRRLGGQQNESLRKIGGVQRLTQRGTLANNPIQDYLRSVAFDPNARYLIRKDVMDTYVKSCAGYSIITYILGVGDRHLDNLLLHQSGSFFHCDFSFILGNDPKTYQPLRVTEDMILGMGGKESDNYAKFLSMMSAAFLALRRPENVRVLLSSVRLMEASYLPDISENQTIEQAIFGIRERLRLDLTDEQALSFVEELVEESSSSKLWLAVDAIHSLGKFATI